ncbi:MAG: DnaJ domain-containing protein [Bacilli bacterium]|nr:DnaJ domain-containing protein [Bacilli bacterium]
MNDYINYYDLLGINKSANVDEIKSAYRNQAKKWHPDLNKDPKAPQMAKKINEAKEILLNEEKRKEYDLYLENYKNGIYDELNKKQNYHNYNNNYEEKTYTKWEYFIFYLKYYKASIFRKFIAIIFVLLESLLCFILQSINYMFAYLISYFGYYITSGLFILGIVLITLLIIKPILDLKLPPNTLIDYIVMIMGSIISLIICAFIQYIPYLLINKIPILISKLNMYLFKISIGYKK